MKHERKKLDSLKAEVLSFASKQEGNLCKLKGNNTLFRLSSSALHAKRRLEKSMPFNASFIEPEVVKRANPPLLQVSKTLSPENKKEKDQWMEKA